MMFFRPLPLGPRGSDLADARGAGAAETRGKVKKMNINLVYAAEINLLGRPRRP